MALDVFHCREPDGPAAGSRSCKYPDLTLSSSRLRRIVRSRPRWRLDPEGSLQGTALEGYVASGPSYEPVEPVGGRLRSGVLGLDLRSERQGRGAVLVFRDPRTGEEFDGSVESAERRRRIAEGELRAAKAELRELKERFGIVTAHLSPPERDL